MKLKAERIEFVDAPLEDCYFLSQHLDIADALSGGHFRARRVDESTFEGGIFGFWARFQLIDGELDRMRGRAYSKYFVQVKGPKFLPIFKLATVGIGEGMRVHEKRTAVKGRIEADVGLLSRLLSIVGSYLFDRLSFHVLNSFRIACERLADSPDEALEMLNEEQRQTVSRYIALRRVGRVRAHAHLSLITADGTTVVKLQVPIPTPKKVSEMVRLSREVRDKLVEGFNRIAKLGALLSTVRAQALETRALGMDLEGDIYGDLLRLGRELYKTYIPLDIHGVLTAALSANNLQVNIDADGPDAGMPWELLHNGDNFLCLGFPVMRIATHSLHVKPMPPVKRVLVVASDPYRDLGEISKEAEKVAEILSRQFEVELLVGKEATKENVVELLRRKRYQVLHYSGHSEFKASTPNLSRLILEEERALIADELYELSKKGDLQFVFLNSCYSGQGSEQMDAIGLAHAFVRSGVPYVLGMRWAVSDIGARMLATELYKGVAEGKSFAEALCEARREVGMSTDWQDPAWASPVLYGA